MWNRPLGGDFDGQEGEKNKWGDRGAKKHKGGESAQRLIDRWVNFSSLLLWIVSFLQISIYYDNCWRLLLKQFISWLFTLVCLCTQVHCGLFHGCGAIVKMTELWLWSSSFHEHGSSPGALGFDKCGCGSGALLFMAPNPAPASVRFHTLIQYFNCHGVPQVEWKVN